MGDIRPHALRSRFGTETLPYIRDRGIPPAAAPPHNFMNGGRAISASCRNRANSPLLSRRPPAVQSYGVGRPFPKYLLTRVRAAARLAAEEEEGKGVGKTRAEGGGGLGQSSSSYLPREEKDKEEEEVEV